MFASSQPCVPTITGKIGKAPMTKKMKHRKMQIAKLYLEELKSILLMEDELPPRVPELPLPSADHADFRINDNITKENAVLMLRAFDHNIKSLTLGTRVVEALCEDYEFLEQQPSPFTRLETLILQLPKTSYKPVSYCRFFYRPVDYSAFIYTYKTLIYYLHS
ncbi:hypothetical protein LINGRAHAP2_LOCUS12950 [Linum grandiflorum]